MINIEDKCNNTDKELVAYELRRKFEALILYMDRQEFFAHVSKKAKAFNRSLKYVGLEQFILRVFDELCSAGDEFFRQPATAETFATFTRRVETLLNAAQKACETQRGWHRLPLEVKEIFGLLAALFVIPALIMVVKLGLEAKENTLLNSLNSGFYGYKNTFFRTPETATFKKFKLFKATVEEQEKNIEAVLVPRSCTNP